MHGTAQSPVHDDTRLPALTGVRFFAALAVMLSHFDHRGIVSVPSGVTDFLDGGRTAVTLFFVLSGFILAYNYAALSGAAERIKFYASRFARIYPVTLLALGLGALGMMYGLTNRGSGALLEWYALKDPSLFNIGGSLLAQLTMTVGWLPTASLNQPWNSPAWSIACEMFFYALFPVLLVKMRRMTILRVSLVLVASFALQCLIIWASRTFAPSGQKGFLVSQFPVTHLFEFLLGIAMALYFLRGGREWVATGNRRALLLGGALLPLAGLAYFRPVDPAYLLMSPFFAILILALAVSPSRRRSVIAWKPFILLGEASFALYMIHVPLLNLYSIAKPPAVVGWILLVATVGASILVFKWIETPARYRVRELVLRQFPRGIQATEASRHSSRL